MNTAGEAIGSTAMAAEDSMGELGVSPMPDVKMVARNHVAEAERAQTAALPIRVERVLVHLTALRTTQRRVVAHHTVAAAKLTAVVVKLTAVVAKLTAAVADIPVVTTSNR